MLDPPLPSFRCCTCANGGRRRRGRKSDLESHAAVRSEIDSDLTAAAATVADVVVATKKFTLEQSVGRQCRKLKLNYATAAEIEQ